MRRPRSQVPVHRTAKSGILKQRTVRSDATEPIRKSSLLRRFLLLVLLTASLAATPADAQFVVYHATLGDWTTTCDRDQVSSRVTCTMSAPPPRMDLEHSGATIVIDESAGAGPSVWFRVRGAIDASKPVLALIDANAPVDGVANRFGEGGWRGAAALALIEAMRQGARMTLVWSVESGPDRRAAQFNLADFPAALADYRRKLAEFGIAGTL